MISLSFSIFSMESINNLKEDSTKNAIRGLKSYDYELVPKLIELQNFISNLDFEKTQKHLYKIKEICEVHNQNFFTYLVDGLNCAMIKKNFLDKFFKDQSELEKNHNNCEILKNNYFKDSKKLKEIYKLLVDLGAACSNMSIEQSEKLFNIGTGLEIYSLEEICLNNFVKKLIVEYEKFNFYYCIKKEENSEDRGVFGVILKIPNTLRFSLLKILFDKLSYLSFNYLINLRLEIDNFFKAPQNLIFNNKEKHKQYLENFKSKIRKHNLLLMPDDQKKFIGLWEFACEHLGIFKSENFVSILEPEFDLNFYKNKFIESDKDQMDIITSSLENTQIAD